MQPGANQIPRERVRTLRQREVERFAELRPRGMRLLERAKASMPNGVPTTWMATFYDHPPIVVESGRGGAFTDVDGNAYIGKTSGRWHGRRLTEALRSGDVKVEGSRPAVTRFLGLFPPPEHV